MKGYTAARLAALIRGNFLRHVNARHGGVQDPECRTCTAHRSALERELTEVAWR